MKDPTICTVRIMTPRGRRVAKTVRVTVLVVDGQCFTILSIAGGTLLSTKALYNSQYDL
eukprot:CAMPEP_0195273854 /NCGR_PEP_ID=MMETSP0706-20130129/16776_1 /TAXON_ID=33640 /ORGANISM="Asterionellopsis glacialis, Strain CCMP134" /LENGTH=58 /DNA_ID=CAMNT_0040330561 /DNA_START=32 /DNA_END=205 /DNA_ORIENTATION=+